MEISKEQAYAFMESLWPCGDNAHLANHTRSFLSGLIGTVPTGLPTKYNYLHHKKLSDALRAIANHLDAEQDND